MSLQQLQSEKEKLTVFQKRLGTDLVELKAANTRLRHERVGDDLPDDGSRRTVSAGSEQADPKGKKKIKDDDDDGDTRSCAERRDSISRMKARMQKLETMSINVAADPAKAIQQIADPILKLIEAKTDHQEAELKDMQLERLRKQKRILELKE